MLSLFLLVCVYVVASVAIRFAWRKKIAVRRRVLSALDTRRLRKLKIWFAVHAMKAEPAFVVLVCAMLGGCRGSETTHQLEKTMPEAATDAHLMELTVRCFHFQSSYGQWPVDINALAAGVRVRTTNLFDGWGVPFYLITLPSSPEVMWIKSYGADGVLGGSGTNADRGIKLEGNSKVWILDL
jgi:hypothetical protein